MTTPDRPSTQVKGDQSQPRDRSTLLSQRSALILFIALMVAACIGTLTYLASRDLPIAAIAAISAFPTTTYFGARIIE